MFLLHKHAHIFYIIFFWLLVLLFVVVVRCIFSRFFLKLSLHSMTATAQSIPIRNAIFLCFLACRCFCHLYISHTHNAKILNKNKMYKGKTQQKNLINTLCFYTYVATYHVFSLVLFLARAFCLELIIIIFNSNKKCIFSLYSCTIYGFYHINITRSQYVVDTVRYCFFIFILFIYFSWIIWVHVHIMLIRTDASNTHKTKKKYRLGNMLYLSSISLTLKQ